MFVQAGPCGEVPSDEQQTWVWRPPGGPITGPHGLCLDAATPGQLMLKPCDGSAAQRFAYDATSQALTLLGGSGPGPCVDLHWKTGDALLAVAQLYGCDGGADQRFAFGAAGTLTDATGQHCLTAARAVPSDPGLIDGLQMWAKALPGGAQAVLVVNHDAAHNATLSIALADIGMPAGARIRDVWRRTDVGAFEGTFTAPHSLGPHDSGFFVLDATSPSG